MITTLGDCVSLLGDGLHGTPIYSEDGDYYFINGNNLSEGKIVIKEDTKRVSESEYKKYKKNLNDRTILVSINGTLGNVGTYNNEKVILGKSACYFNVKSNIDKNFIKYTVSTNTFKYYSETFATGATIKNLSLAQIKKYKFQLPPLPTQQKIASILSAYDNLIQNYKKQIEALQTAASELYKEWFVRFRFPRCQTTKFENGIPKGWKVYRINDLCYINKNTVSSKDAKKEILYLDTGSITENVIDSFESYILEEAPSRARRIVKKNSIIFSTVRPNQNHYGILKTIPENLIVSTGFAVFDTKFDIANILYFFLSSKNFVDYCQMIAEGAVATYPSIKPEEIGKVKILLPTIDLTIKLNQSFESLFLRIENLQKQITNLTQQRDLLLPRLVSGKIEVK